MYQIEVDEPLFKCNSKQRDRLGSKVNTPQVKVLSMLSVSREHIEITPEVRGGKPRITGTRIAVEDIIVMHLRMGLSLPEIAVKYDLSMASVHAAMAYYFDHQEMIDCTLAEDEAFVEAFKRNHPSRLQEKLRNLRGC